MSLIKLRPIMNLINKSYIKRCAIIVGVGGFLYAQVLACELPKPKKKRCPFRPPRTIRHGFDRADDFDQDGIPNWWETVNGGGPISMDDDGDDDGDGISNKDEFICDTDPKDKNSKLMITEARVTQHDERYVIHWNSAARRMYTVHWTTNLLGGEYHLLVKDVDGTPPVNVCTDSVHHVEQTVYYRVTARLDDRIDIDFFRRP